MYVFGEIDKSSTTIENNVVNYTQNLSASVDGIQSIKIVSGSINNNYWNSLNVLFYSSGSKVYNGELKFSAPLNSLSYPKRLSSRKQFTTKYHGYPSSSVITIPQQYYGEEIKPGTFQFTDLNNPDSSGNNPIIEDDGFGNLYATNAHHSQSTTDASSSQNYVGNIFYERGLAVITETGSWSSSVNYSDLATNYTLKFDSHHTIYSHEYSVTLLPQDYNLTTNYGIRAPLSGSTFSLETPFIASTFTGSEFQPYITQINLWKDGVYDSPVLQANLPRPIRKTDKINLNFKIKLDM